VLSKNRTAIWVTDIRNYNEIRDVTERHAVLRRLAVSG
jgi:hypothetical protein